MIMHRFLSVFLFAFLINVPAFSQFNLIKDFDGGAENSFGFTYGGPLYSIGTKMLVQYDSIVNRQHVNIAALAAVDAAGNTERLASSNVFPDLDGIPFFDFKTLPDGRVAFINIESVASYKVIITNGTVAGTTTVYSTTTHINGLELIDNGLYFTHDGSTQQALMKVDLTTLAVSEVAVFGSLHAISDISKVSNTALIFMAADAADNDKLKLYVSDGTAAGTSALALINSGSEVSEKALLTQVGNKVYFFSKLPDVTCCSALWVTDGTVAGTQKLKELMMLSADHLIRQEMFYGWNNRFYFAGTENTSGSEHILWVSDGTVAGTTPLMAQSVENIHPRFFTVFKNALYFITVSGTHYANKLYKTDGTSAGTVPVELKYNADVVSPYALAADEDYLYLGGGNVNAAFQEELFRYDGINSQCGMLEGAHSSLRASKPQDLFLHEGELYFTAYIAGSGIELCTTEGDFTQGIATSTTSAASVSCMIYPNPTKDLVTVKSTEPIVLLRLINQLGAVIMETSESTLNVSSYPVGVYYVEVVFATQETLYQKVIVSK
jgi:ELWxxDGT repeat protein